MLTPVTTAAALTRMLVVVAAAAAFAGGCALAASPAGALTRATAKAPVPGALVPERPSTPGGADGAASTPPPAPDDLPAFDLSRPEIRSFVTEATAAGVPRSAVIAALKAAEPQSQIVDAMNRPAEKTLQWWEYRARMLTPGRIEAGAELWREHKELLDEIAIRYQVPPEYVIAVLGVESLYGRFMGRYRVLDALATLAFDYPPRSHYFRHELVAFLLLAREQHLDPLTVRGSYAGAMGALQFEPSSYRKYAVAEGRGAASDLWTNWGDIFASTANFLHQAGWIDGAPVLADCQASSSASLDPSEHMVLDRTLQGLRQQGLTIDSAMPGDTPVILLAAPEADAMHYRVGFHNFYVITRYNNSPLYAMAVYDLAQAIRERIALEAAL